jgi:hypothetical protein
MQSHTYKVTVGNVGIPYEGDNRSKAFRVYEDYLKQSKQGKGRAGGEGVFLYQNEEIIREYIGVYDEIYRSV